jgi:hypothetical protein
MHHGMALLLHLCISAAARMSKAPAQLTRMSSYTNVQLHRHAMSSYTNVQLHRHAMSSYTNVQLHRHAMSSYTNVQLHRQATPMSSCTATPPPPPSPRKPVA